MQYRQISLIEKEKTNRNSVCNCKNYITILKGKISYTDQNHFLYPAENIFVSALKVGHVNMGGLWDFAACL